MVTKSGGYCKIVGHMELVNLRWSSFWEGKSRFQTSAVLRLYPVSGKASGVNPDEKYGARVPKAVLR